MGTDLNNPEEELSGADLIEYYEENEIDYDISEFSKEEIFEYASNNLMFDYPDWMRENFTIDEFLECAYNDNKQNLSNETLMYAFFDRHSTEDLELIYETCFENKPYEMIEIVKNLFSKKALNEFILNFSHKSHL